ncbi:MAG: 1-acyl-sn-glycerol-3-phosphate acyltransferase [Spirochaetales bacterium]|nr:1-acyl-sn-glycerol-3-phosphate acyltransferase [Spirochaetales bacterium]
MLLFRYIHSYVAYISVGLLFVVVIIFGLLPMAVLRSLGFEKSAYRWFNRYVKLISKGIFFVIGSRVTVYGKEHLPSESEGRRICIYANHQSLLDIPLIAGFLPYLPAFVAKDELRKVPVISTFMRAMRCITLKRGDGKSSLKMMVDGIRLVKQGVPLVVYPEGTRSRANTMLEPKAGSFKIAAKAKADIIPVTITNTHKIFKSGRYIEPAHVYLFIHPPIATESMSRQDLRGLSDLVKGQIAAPLESTHSG